MNDFDDIVSLADRLADKIAKIVISTRKAEVIESLTESELGELAAAHDQIVQRQNAREIATWVGENIRDRQRKNVWTLFVLFEDLCEAKIEPFSDGRVSFDSPPPDAPDWSIVPSNLAYIIPFAEKLEYMADLGDPEWYDAIDEFSEATRKSLIDLANRHDADYDAVRAFTRQYRMTEYRASWLIYRAVGAAVIYRDIARDA